MLQIMAHSCYLMTALVVPGAVIENHCGHLIPSFASEVLIPLKCFCQVHQILFVLALTRLKYIIILRYSLLVLNYDLNFLQN